MGNALVRDVLERAVWTFVQAFVAAIAGAELFLDGGLNLGAVESAAVAGVAAVISLVKGLVASKVGARNAALPG